MTADTPAEIVRPDPDEVHRAPPRDDPSWPVPWTPVEGARGGFMAWLEYAAYRSITGGLSILPRFALRPIIGGLARIARRVDKKHTRSAEVFLRQALGQDLPQAEVDERVLQAYRHLIEVTIRSPGWKKYVLADNWHERVELELSPEFRALRDRGSIMICPHVGDWEAAGGFLVRLGYGPVYAIAKPAKNKPLSRFIQATREGRGVRMLPRHGGIQHAAAIIEGGGMLCLLIDQRARERGVLVPFFGRPALCDRSAGVLLKRLKAPITVGAVYWSGDRHYRVKVDAQTVFEPEDFEGQSVEQIIARINVELEKQILRHPEQYFWLHERYRGAPPVGETETPDGDQRSNSSAR